MLLRRIPQGDPTLRRTLRRTEKTITTTRIVLSTEQPREGGAYMSALYGDGDLGCLCFTAVDDCCFSRCNLHAEDTRGRHDMSE